MPKQNEKPAETKASPDPAPDVSLLAKDYQPEEDQREQTLRPRRLADFQGQEELKRNLAVFIQAARGRGECLDHVFLSGPPGLGKTTLAVIIAAEMNAELKITAAPALEKPKDLAGILTTLTERTVFFIDEVHRLKPALEEMLYVAMEDYEIDWVIGQGPSARTIRIPLPRFSLIGATTRAGLVASPLHSRFGINIRFDFYSPEEIRKILLRSSGILEVALEEDACAELAACSRGPQDAPGRASTTRRPSARARS